MRISIIMAQGRIRGWQAKLADRLAALGHEVGVELVDGQPLPASIAVLFGFEQLVHGQQPLRGPALLDVAGVRALAAHYPALADAALEIDLGAGAAPPRTGVPRISPLYDGTLCEAMALLALMDGRVPRLGVIGEADALLMEGLPAIEQPRLVSAGFAALCARMQDMLVRAVALQQTGAPPPATTAAIRSPAFSLPGFALLALRQRVQALLSRLCERPPQWEICWRRTAGDGTATTLALPGRGWTPLWHPAGRFVADPFIACRDGRTVMFFEEFPYASGRGLISMAEIGPQGQCGEVRPVLETGGHLSYPFLFEDGGELFMIPESCGAGRIDLYRCTRFPDHWVYDTTLIDGVAASDATLVRHGGRLWLFCTISGAEGSSWDALHLYHAPHLRGPWTPHALNPVVVDASCARPGGAMFHHDGALWRPAQDCTGAYGSALNLVQVKSLTPDDYSQSIERRFTPHAIADAHGLHTLNAAAGIEAVDLCFARGRQIRYHPR